MLDLPVWVTAASVVLGPTGAAWVGVRTALNGTRERVKRIDKTLDRMDGDLTEVRERVSKIEGGLGL